MFGIHDCSKLPAYLEFMLPHPKFTLVNIVILLACSVARSINATSSLQLSLLYLKW